MAFSCENILLYITETEIWLISKVIKKHLKDTLRVFTYTHKYFLYTINVSLVIILRYFIIHFNTSCNSLRTSFFYSLALRYLNIVSCGIY